MSNNSLSLSEVKKKYESSISRSNVDGICHDWKFSSEFSTSIEFWSEKGVLVQPHIWAYEQKNGPLPRGKILWRLCDNYLCQNEEHWILDRSISKKERQEIRKKFRTEGVRVPELVEQHRISMALIGRIINFLEEDIV